LLRFRAVRAVKALLVGLFCCSIASPAMAGYEESLGDSHPAPRWVLPLDGPLGSPFGYRWGRLHEGIDIEGWAETHVHAARNGVVIRVGWLKGMDGYGLVVKVRHDDGFVTMYAHLAKSLVRRGDFVTAGQLIARAGCTGSCTGVHLHFQMWHEGKLVDPVRFLGRRAFVR
jgi:murein DD-endopeptidase MepM/ murein hydrolase activator NlpD